MVSRMKINEINHLNYVLNVKKSMKVKKIDQERSADRAEISEEAKALSQSSNFLTPERIAEIKTRINENFYDKDEVLKTVAERILRSHNFQELIRGNRLDKNF